MISNLFDREPAILLGLVNAALALAVGFGLSVSAEQVALINAFVGTVISFVIRSQVSST